MCSEDYKDRFKAEFIQLYVRRNKLQLMLDKWDAGELTFIPTCPRSIYDIQLRAMNEYLAILEARARIEGLSLDL